MNILSLEWLCLEHEEVKHIPEGWQRLAPEIWNASVEIEL